MGRALLGEIAGLGGGREGGGRGCRGGAGLVSPLGTWAFVAGVAASALGARLHDMVLGVRALDGPRLPVRVHVALAVPGARDVRAWEGGRFRRVPNLKTCTRSVLSTSVNLRRIKLGL